MLYITDKKDCCGCAACYNICPQGCIKMEYDEEGFLFPRIDSEKCVNCKLCQTVCPNSNKVDDNNKGICYACKIEDNNIRKDSSSGGVFSALVKYIIMNNGVVFGAKFDSDYTVKHDYAEKIEECNRFRGSKYVQSCVEDSYLKVKKFL